jgi:hypothetical protein
MVPIGDDGRGEESPLALAGAARFGTAGMTNPPIGT